MSRRLVRLMDAARASSEEEESDGSSDQYSGDESDDDEDEDWRPPAEEKEIKQTRREDEKKAAPVPSPQASKKEEHGGDKPADKDKPAARGSQDDGCECPVCQSLIQGPVTPPCGHSLCQACMFRVPNNKCPICRQDAPKTLYYKNWSLVKAMHKMFGTPLDGGYDMDTKTNADKCKAESFSEVARTKRLCEIDALVDLILHRMQKATLKGHNFIKLRYTDKDTPARAILNVLQEFRDRLSQLHFHVALVDDGDRPCILITCA